MDMVLDVRYACRERLSMLQRWSQRKASGALETILSLPWELAARLERLPAVRAGVRRRLATAADTTRWCVLDGADWARALLAATGARLLPRRRVAVAPAAALLFLALAMAIAITWQADGSSALAGRASETPSRAVAAATPTKSPVRIDARLTLRQQPLHAAAAGSAKAETVRFAPLPRVASVEVARRTGPARAASRPAATVRSAVAMRPALGKVASLRPNRRAFAPSRTFARSRAGATPVRTR